jgi:hypothetical protein
MRTIVDLILVAGADVALVVDEAEAVARRGNDGLTRDQKMRSQSSYEPLDEYLERGGSNQAEEQSHLGLGAR